MVEKKIFGALCTKTSIEVDFFASLNRSWFDRIYISTSPGIDQARNECVEAFLESDCTHLIWIDSDIIFPRNFDHLFTYDHPLVAPLCWTGTRINGRMVPVPGVGDWTGGHKFVFWNYKRLQDEVAASYATSHPGLVWADVVGGGSYMVERKILGEMKDETGNCFRWCWRNERGKLEYGEDIYFFMRANNDKGLRWAVDTTVNVGHYKWLDMKDYASVVYGFDPANPVLVLPNFTKATTKSKGHDAEQSKNAS